MTRNPVRRDTRKHGRASLELSVVVRDAESRAKGAIRFDSADVSGGGAFLRSDLLFEIGDLITIEFDLPGGGPHVSARGRVVRVSRGSSGRRDEAPGMGVEFIDLSPGDRAAIEERL
jgi:c-di-GMP-binding flagellar brake protein YcgR